MYQNIVKAHSVTNDRKVERRKEMVHQVLKSNFFHSLQINNLNVMLLQLSDYVISQHINISNIQINFEY